MVLVLLVALLIALVGMLLVLVGAGWFVVARRRAGEDGGRPVFPLALAGVGCLVSLGAVAGITGLVVLFSV